MRFTYKELAPGFYAPFVTLNLNGQRGWIGFEAYVDSGASFSIFQAERSEILGLSYRRGTKIFITVGDGDAIEVFIHKVDVEIAGHKFLAEMGFSSQLGIGFNLLGRKSFFEKFDICFHEARRTLELIPT